MPTKPSCLSYKAHKDRFRYALPGHWVGRVLSGVYKADAGEVGLGAAGEGGLHRADKSAVIEEGQDDDDGACQCAKIQGPRGLSIQDVTNKQ
jgi:hypothetical protein